MTAALKIPTDIIGEIALQWDDMTPRERRDRTGAVAQEYEVNISTVYRRIKDRRECARMAGCGRADRGKPRLADESDLREYVSKVMGFKALDPMKPDRKIGNPNKCMSTRRAIEILENMGEIPNGLLNARTVNRWARAWRITVADMCAPTAAVKLKSLYPNHVHVIDFSVCEQYYLRDSDGKIISRPWTYKNKPNESRQKIWAFSLVDHYSNVKYIRYFLSPGESSDILFRSLVAAWTKKDDPQFPFHGAPTILYADKGSALKSERIQNLLHALNIKVLYHKPGNPRAKGMVESSFKHLQVDFESELRHAPAGSVDELNERVYNWLVRHNWNAKESETAPRFSRWQEISREQLLELPPPHILRRVTASHEIRTVDAYGSISLHNETYGVPEALIGRKVRVWNTIDGGIALQDIETGEVHGTVDERVAVFGSYNSHPRSDAERAQDAAIAAAGEISKRVTPDVLMRDVPNIAGFPQAGTPIEMNSPLTPLKESAEYDSAFQAKQAIADELRMNLGDLPDWLLDEIDSALEMTLDKGKVLEIARYAGTILNEAQAV